MHSSCKAVPERLARDGTPTGKKEPMGDEKKTEAMTRPVASVGRRNIRLVK